MTSKIADGYIYTECTKDTKYGYHIPPGGSYSGSKGAAAYQARDGYTNTAKKNYTYTSTYQANDGTKLPCGHVVNNNTSSYAVKNTYQANGGTKLPCGHVVNNNTSSYAVKNTYQAGSSGAAAGYSGGACQANTVSKSVNYGAARAGGYVDCKSHIHAGGKKTKCQCPLYTYKRYDKIDPVKVEPPHYPTNLRTIYTKDYTPKEADKNPDFSPIRTAQKSYPIKDNYLTIHKKDYTPKKARSTTPIKQPEHKYIVDVPIRGPTEYQDMIKDAPDHMAYHPVKKQPDPYIVKHGFPEKTEYNHEYTPKRAPKDTAANITLQEILRSPAQKLIGPMDDRTIYKGDYTPKKANDQKVMIMKAHDSNPMPRAKLFDGLTIYKKDYIPPEMYQCECPEYEAADFEEHTHNHLHGETVLAGHGGSGSHHHIHEIQTKDECCGDHHHIHEVQNNNGGHTHVVEHIHESGPGYKYEKLEKSPLKTASHTYRETLGGNNMNASGRYFERSTGAGNRSLRQTTGEYMEMPSGDVRGTVISKEGGAGKSSHLHYIETMCDDHGSPHKHYIETLCPDHHHIHTVDN